MTYGSLHTEPALRRLDLLAAPVGAAIGDWSGTTSRDAFLVAAIDASLADTAAFCERYDVPPERAANCVVLAARREGRAWYAACVVLATTRADVNGLAKRTLGASKISFAPMADATSVAGMEYGAITPVGLPAEWPVLVDARVVTLDWVVVGGGLRASKLVLPGTALGESPNARVLEGLGLVPPPPSA